MLFLLFLPGLARRLFVSFLVEANSVYKLLQRIISFRLTPWFQFAFVWLIVEGTRQTCLEIKHWLLVGDWSLCCVRCQLEWGHNRSRIPGCGLYLVCPEHSLAFWGTPTYGDMWRLSGWSERLCSLSLVAAENLIFILAAESTECLAEPFPHKVLQPAVPRGRPCERC